MDALQVHGWTLFAHPLFLDQVETLAARVKAARAGDPEGYRNRNDSKRLAAIARLAFDVIPQDPERPEYRLGQALGEDRRHWFRAKFFQQCRLFFRFHKGSRILVLAWVNDEQSKRAYESANDAYHVFRKMLQQGHPPDDWEALLAAAKSATARTRALQQHRSP